MAALPSYVQSAAFNSLMTLPRHLDTRHVGRSENCTRNRIVRTLRAVLWGSEMQDKIDICSVLAQVVVVVWLVERVYLGSDLRPHCPRVVSDAAVFEICGAILHNSLPSALANFTFSLFFAPSKSNMRAIGRPVRRRSRLEMSEQRVRPLAAGQGQIDQTGCTERRVVRSAVPSVSNQKKSDGVS